MNKKFLTMVAAAMMFAACSNDADTVKESAELAQNSQEQTPVLFGAYLNRATTRAGYEGEVTLDHLKSEGFGVFGYYTDGELFSDFAKPNFMYNEKVWSDDGSDWKYEPVKYWPNEFGPDATSDGLDRVSFFAYGPHVEVTPGTGVVTGDHTSGIIGMTQNTVTGDPYVKYAVSTDPTKQVDFIWGVAAGDNSPQPIIGGAHQVKKGTPFLDLVKPAEEQEINFDFHHALAALNVQVDALFDVDAASSTNDVDANSKIYIRSITFDGIATEGAFNLNQAVEGAAWSELCCSNTIDEASFTIYDGLRDGREGAGIEAANEKTVGLNKAIIQKTGSAGVTKTAVNLFNADNVNAPIYIIPATSANTTLKVNVVYDVETTDKDVITTLSDGKTKGVSTTNNITKETTLNLEAGKKYILKLHLGMTSVKFEAEAADWTDGEGGETYLPKN